MSQLLASEPDGLSGGPLEEMLDCLEVPEDRLTTSASLLRSLIRIAHMDHAFDIATREQETDRRDLKKLAKKVAAVRAALGKLNDRTRVRLGAVGCSLDPDPEAERAVQNCDVAGTRHDFLGRSRYERFCSEIDVLAASTDSCCRRGPAGQRSKEDHMPKSTTALDHLVLLLYAGARDGHWRVSVEPQDRTGTLVEFLKVAEPHLPAGLVPPHLWNKTANDAHGGWKRFQRIGTEMRRADPNEAGWFSEKVAEIEWTHWFANVKGPGEC